MSIALAHVIWMWSGIVAAALSCLYGFWRGGTTERLGAAIIAIAWTLSLLMTSHAGHGPGTAIMVIDCATAVAFAALSLWSRKIWTLVATACMFNDVLTHLLASATKMSIFDYVTATGLWSGWGPVIALAVGVWLHNRPRAKA